MSNQAHQLRDAIQNFLLPDSKETLRSLSSMTYHDLTSDIQNKCVCGCVMHTSIIKAFERADLESLQFIVNERLLTPDVLCAALSMMFKVAGSNQYPARKIYEYKLNGLDYEKEAAEKEGSRICAGWIVLSLDTADYLLNYLCKEHPAIVAEWRSVDPDEPGTLLHRVYQGYNRYKKREWTSKLLSVGCNIFANYSPVDLTAPFISILDNLDLDLIIDRLPNQHELPKMTEVVNYISPDEMQFNQRNSLQWCMYKWRYTKNIDNIQKLKKVILLFIQLGIDLAHTDVDGLNSIDYINYYGYRELVNLDNSPNATGLEPKKYRITKTHNPTKYVDLFYKYRYAKTEDKFNELNLEYDYLKKTQQPIQEILDDTGNNTYESLANLIDKWQIDDVIQEF